MKADTNVAKLWVTGTTQIFYSKFGEITGKIQGFLK